MITFGGFTIVVGIIVTTAIVVIATCVVFINKPPKLSAAEYDRQIAKMDEDRLAQIDTAKSIQELDDIDARWSLARSQIRRARS